MENVRNFECEGLVSLAEASPSSLSSKPVYASRPGEVVSVIVSFRQISITGVPLPAVATPEESAPA
jgi:hypothetical protein